MESMNSDTLERMFRNMGWKDLKSSLLVNKEWSKLANRELILRLLCTDSLTNRIMNAPPQIRRNILTHPCIELRKRLSNRGIEDSKYYVQNYQGPAKGKQGSIHLTNNTAASLLTQLANGVTYTTVITIEALDCALLNDLTEMMVLGVLSNLKCVRFYDMQINKCVLLFLKNWLLIPRESLEFNNMSAGDSDTEFARWLSSVHLTNLDFRGAFPPTSLPTEKARGIKNVTYYDIGLRQNMERAFVNATHISTEDVPDVSVD